MGWFERYGIPGIYFVLFLATLYWVIFGFPPSTNAQMIVAVFAVAISASLPAGYILSIISMRIYYCYKKSWQVHYGPWQQAWGNQSKSIIDSEEIVEAEVAVLGRLRIKSQEADKRRWFQEWCTKRMDVLAINHTIIWATFIGYGLGAVAGGLGSIGLCFPKPIPMLMCPHRWPCLLLHIGISLVILFGLISSTRLLNRQVRYALVKFFTDLRKINV